MPIKPKLSETLDPAEWFNDIKPLINWGRLTPLIPEFTKMLKDKGLNTEEQFAFCYAMSCEALRHLDRSRGDIG